MYGPLIAAAAILLVVAAIALYLHDLAEARSRRAYDRIFEEGLKATGRGVPWRDSYASSALARPKSR
jgi:hypothetical protein